MTSPIYSGRVRTRGCAIVLKSDALLLVRQNVPTRRDPVWLAPGGEVELGETARDAAKRETLEETGIVIEPIRLVAIHEFIEPPYHAVELYFSSEIIGGSLIVGSDPEYGDNDQHIMEAEFVPIGQLKDLKIAPEFLINVLEIADSASQGKVLHISAE